MSGLIKLILTVMLFFVSITHVCVAKTENILSGRDLLKVIREKDGNRIKPAYTNRLSKSTKTTSTNNHSKPKSESPKRISIDDKETKSSNAKIKLYRTSSEISFAEAISILRNSVEPPLNIVVMWRDLEDNAGIDHTTPINIDAISGVPLGTALKLVLESVSGTIKLDYIVKDGVIIIATKQKLPKRLETRVYNVSGLLGQPAFYRGQLGSPSRGSFMNGFRSPGR